ncbi:hypothetical protein CCP1ISM_20004 [Azospirillaceae bacterium]
MLSLDKAIKVEPYVLGPDRSFPDITKIDLVATKNKCQTIVVSHEFCDLIVLMKTRINSKYNIMLEVDPEGATFGLNKMLHKVNYNALNGCEIGLSKNKNYTELVNEMKVVTNFLKQYNNGMVIRWIINASHGTKHIENCIKAIREAKDIKYDLIRIITPSNVPFEKRIELGELIRNGIGVVQARIKIEAEVKDVVALSNVFFSVHASKL